MLTPCRWKAALYSFQARAVSLTGLISGSAMNVRVRAPGGLAGFSDWSAPFFVLEGVSGEFRHRQGDGFPPASTSRSAAMMQSRIAAASGAARSRESRSVLSAIRQRRDRVCR